MNRTVIIIMAKEPQPGKTKTRLTPPLTPQQGAELYEALLLDTIHFLANLEWADLAVAFTPADSKRYFEKKSPLGTMLVPIDGVDIGDCLVQAFEQLLGDDYDKAIAINADSPSLPLKYLQKAVDMLDDHDVVFGESSDGGYYLVGLSRLYKVLFQDITWSTSKVLTQSLKQAKEIGLSVALTPVWYDVDTFHNVLRLKDDLTYLPGAELTHTRQFLFNQVLLD